MPLYTFVKNSTGDKIDFYMSINDLHILWDSDLEEWERVFTAPSAHINDNPDSVQAFVDKTSKAGTLGEVFDRSMEAAEKRAKKNGGIDPVSQKAFDKYAKKRGGKLHPRDPRNKKPGLGNKENYK